MFFQYPLCDKVNTTDLLCSVLSWKVLIILLTRKKRNHALLCYADFEQSVLALRDSQV